jgi:hypothetical protein
VSEHQLAGAAVVESTSRRGRKAVDPRRTSGSGREVEPPVVGNPPEPLGHDPARLQAGQSPQRPAELHEPRQRAGRQPPHRGLVRVGTPAFVQQGLNDCYSAAQPRLRQDGKRRRKPGGGQARLRRLNRRQMLAVDTGSVRLDHNPPAVLQTEPVDAPDAAGKELVARDTDAEVKSTKGIDHGRDARGIRRGEHVPLEVKRRSVLALEDRGDNRAQPIHAEAFCRPTPSPQHRHRRIVVTVEVRWRWWRRPACAPAARCS